MITPPTPALTKVKKQQSLAELKAAAIAAAGGMLIEPGATHTVLRPFGFSLNGEAATARPGDRVNAEHWMHREKLEKLRYIRPIDAKGLADATSPVPVAPEAALELVNVPPNEMPHLKENPGMPHEKTGQP